MAEQEFTIEELETEIWRPVVGYETTYAISSLGRVKRTKVVAGCRAGRILRPRIGKDYAYVILSNGSRRSRRTNKVHVMVAAAFIGARPQGMQINHLDGVKKNNRFENLEYCTPSENSLHAIRLGIKPSRGETNCKARLTEAQVLTIRQLHATGTPQVELARRYGVGHATVSHIVVRRTWSHI